MAEELTFHLEEFEGPLELLLRLGEIFRKMIQGEATAEEIDELEEAGALKDISHMPARVKCAVLGWRTLKEAIGGEEK